MRTYTQAIAAVCACMLLAGCLRHTSGFVKVTSPYAGFNEAVINTRLNTMPKLNCPQVDAKASLKIDGTVTSKASIDHRGILAQEVSVQTSCK